MEDEEEACTVMKAAYDAGIRTFDTADIYSDGLSEVLVGKFLKKYNIERESIVILSKCCFFVNEDNVGTLGTPVQIINRQGLSRKHILDAVDASVRRLGTFIDVLQIHRYDKETPEAETMKLLNDVILSGKVRYIGASSMYVYQFASMQHTAEMNGWLKFISMQNCYNLLYREEEREVIPYCNKTKVGLIPWAPVAAGALTRPTGNLGSTTRASFNPSVENGYLTETNVKIVDRVEELAKKYGVNMAVISLAWTIAKGCSPIVGITKLERIADAVDAMTFKLSEEDQAYLEELYQPQAIKGHW